MNHYRFEIVEPTEDDWEYLECLALDNNVELGIAELAGGIACWDGGCNFFWRMDGEWELQASF